MPSVRSNMRNNFFNVVNIELPDFLKNPAAPDRNSRLHHLHQIFGPVPAPFVPRFRRSALPPESFIITKNADKSLTHRCFTGPGVGLIELGNRSVDMISRIETVAAYDAIGLFITAKTASKIKIASALCQQAQPFHDIAANTLAHIELAVHEASLNALAHGNLGLKSAFEETGDNLEEYYRIVHKRAHSRDFQNSRIDILGWQNGDHVFVAVGDQGAGYRMPKRRIIDGSGPQPDDRRHSKDRRQSGRGLDIISRFSEQFWLSPRGSSIVMMFKK